ncbi:toxin ParE1/3/4 [Rhizobiales bacterium GAS191]|jgi:toxin ParE1/3/4|nr:toxin ParE1/3/4 [Rhizobiales bacterium GAS113]SEC35809.1 toxin ParE1/3/4 [Rhizobiales bacterium GAS191]SEC90154.1 toxin ParE1/3/4 [Rhizobiales bacterium GAS188]
MTLYVLRPRAQRDIEEIWDYTAATWSVAQAEAYIRQIQRSFEMLADDPRRGRNCEDIRAGYRRFRTGSHFIFYRTLEDGVDIVRILHQSMDFEQHL